MADTQKNLIKCVVSSALVKGMAPAAALGGFQIEPPEVTLNTVFVLFTPATLPLHERFKDNFFSQVITLH